MNVTPREELLPLTPQTQQILLALALGRLNGYEIMAQVTMDTKGLLEIGPGTVYPALRRLVALGFVAEDASGGVARRGKPGNTYELTAFGRQVLGWEVRRQYQIAELARDRLGV